MTIPIIQLRKLWFTLSGIIVALSVLAIVLFPLKFGIDFTGGSLLEVVWSGEQPSASKVTALLGEKGYGESIVQTVGENGTLIRLKTLDEPSHISLLSDLNEKFGDVEERRFESVGPTVGEELRTKAVWSVILVLLAIALFIAFAFRKVSRPVASWKYGLVTLIVSVLHDVLLPLAVFAVLGKFLNVEINSAFIAAILTVLGFSVHDTIVVFDRIRENLSKHGGNFEEAVEQSVNQTLSRSLNTSLTTIFPLVAIYFWGGETLRYFALTLIVGIAAGTYSSVFLAAPLLVVMQKKR